MRGASELIMNDAKRSIEDLILGIKNGEVDLREAWEKIVTLKERYVKQYSQQSWNTFIGNKFQQAIFLNLKGYFNRLKTQNPEFKNVDVFSESQVKGNEIIERKLAVKYGECLLLPDIDMAIVNYNFEDPWKSEVLAIVSCKTSLRERIAQACYWKLKLLASKLTESIHVMLATTDNDQDFFIANERGQYPRKQRDRCAGKHRNRIIAEFELDGVYILRQDFKKEWESSRVKRYEKIFDDILQSFTSP